MPRKQPTKPSIRRRIAGRVASLRRRFPALRPPQKGEAVAAYAALLITRDELMQAMLDGKMDERKWRALSEAHRQVESLGSRLGLIPAPVRAVPPEEPEPDDEPRPRTTNQEKRRRLIYGDDEGEEAPLDHGGAGSRPDTEDNA